MERHWKHIDLPAQQLALNLRELSSIHTYPPHWRDFLREVPPVLIRGLTFVDLGCGVGSQYKVLRDNHYENPYIGVDFSDAMVRLARATWQADAEFRCEDALKTTVDATDQVVHCSGLFDVLEDNVGALVAILKMGAKYVLINRIDLEDSATISTYIAYGGHTIIRHTFSRSEFETIVRDHGYHHRDCGRFHVLTKNPA